MRLEQFSYVVTIARSRSLSAAAKKLYISQPALSNSIHSLEKELGFAIFERTPQGVTLTEKGTAFYQIALRICNELVAVEKLCQKESHTDFVSLAVVPAAVGSLAMELVTAAKREQPELTIQILEMRSGEIFSTVSSGKADIGLSNYTTPNQKIFMERVQEHQLRVETLLKDNLYAFVPAASPFARARMLTMKEIDLPLLAFSDRQLPPGAKKPTYFFSGRSSLMSGIAESFGYAVLPGMMAVNNSYLKSGAVKVVRLRDVPPATFVILYHKQNFAEEEFFLAERLRQLSRRLEKKLQSELF